MSEVILHY